MAALLAPPARPVFADDAMQVGGPDTGYSELFPRVTETDSPPVEKRARRKGGRGSRGGGSAVSSSDERDPAATQGGPTDDTLKDATFYRERGAISEAQFQDITKEGISLGATLRANEAARERVAARRAVSTPAPSSPLFAGTAARSLATTFHEMARQGTLAASEAARPAAPGGGRKRGKAARESSPPAEEAPADDPMEGVDA